jgi:hypothetical protein
MAKKLKLSGSQTTDAYKQRIENAFAKLPGALQGSETTPAYKQTLTDAFQRLKDNNPQLGGVDPARAQYDSLLNDARNTYGTQYQNTLADSIAGEGSTALDLGATLGSRDGLDPTAVTQGSFDWNNVEASNPFSKAALLVRNYHQEQNRTTNGLAAQGQLYSGAINNARGNDTFGFQQGQDSLYKVLQGYLGGQARARRDAALTRDSSINGAGLTGLGTLLGG